MVNRTPAPTSQQLVLDGVQAHDKLPDSERWQHLVIKFADVRNMPKAEDLRRTPEEMVPYTATFASGQEEDVEVSLTADGGWQIEHGRHRCFAMHSLGWTEFRAKFRKDRTPAQRAVARCMGNDQQVPSTPYEAALDYRTLQQDGATIARIAELVGKSEATVSFRLSLLKLAPSIAQRVGRTISNDAAQVLLALHEHPDLLARAEAAVPTEAELAKARRSYVDDWTMKQVVTKALTTGKNAPAVDLQDEQVSSHHERNDPDLVKAASKLPHVRVGHHTLYLDPPKLRHLVDEARERIKKRESTRRTAPRSPDQEKARQRVRLERAARTLQTATMVKHVKSRTSWGPDLLKALMTSLLRRSYNVAQAKADRLALEELAGIKNLQLKPELVDKLWAKDRDALHRLIVGILFLQGRDYNGKVVRDDDLAQLTTGLSFKEIETAARKGLNAKDDAQLAKAKVAKPAKVKAAGGPAKAKAPSKKRLLTRPTSPANDPAPAAPAVPEPDVASPAPPVIEVSATA